MTNTREADYDAFVRRSEEYDVDVTRVAADETTDAIADRIEQPAVGAPLPWDDVTLPDGVRTDPTPADLDDAATGVTAATLGVASYGSIVVTPSAEGAEPVSLFSDRHLAVLREEDLVADMATAFDQLGQEFRESTASGIVATGPSATADMGELVYGAHGPKAVEVVVVE